MALMNALQDADDVAKTILKQVRTTEKSIVVDEGSRRHSQGLPASGGNYLRQNTRKERERVLTSLQIQIMRGLSKR